MLSPFPVLFVMRYERSLICDTNVLQKNGFCCMILLLVCSPMKSCLSFRAVWLLFFDWKLSSRLSILWRDDQLINGSLYEYQRVDNLSLKVPCQFSVWYVVFNRKYYIWYNKVNNIYHVLGRKLPGTFRYM